MTKAVQAVHFLKPGRFARLLNRAVGVLAGLGIGPAYIHLLEVRGRKTGRLYRTPVNLLRLGGAQFLVCGRGHSSWSKNAAAAGEATLKRGAASRTYRVVPLDGDEKLDVLKAYLEEYPRTVQRFFTVPAGSPRETFREIANCHPAFRLDRLDPKDPTRRPV